MSKDQMTRRFDTFRMELQKETLRSFHHICDDVSFERRAFLRTNVNSTMQNPRVEKTPSAIALAKMDEKQYRQVSKKRAIQSRPRCQITDTTP